MKLTVTYADPPPPSKRGPDGLETLVASGGDLRMALALLRRRGYRRGDKPTATTYTVLACGPGTDITVRWVRPKKRNAKGRFR